MGDPTSTPTAMLHAFETRYAAFRDELPVIEQALFDEAYGDCFRHVTALNRRPGIDYERPVFLAMLLAEKRRVRDLQREVARLRQWTDDLTKTLEDHHGIRLPPLRGTRPLGVELDRLGQARLPHYPEALPIPTKLPGGPTAEAIAGC